MFQFINCGHFWIQNDEDGETTKLKAIGKNLQCQLLPITEQISSGDLFAAPYEDADGRTDMYRVRVVNLMPNDMVWVSVFGYKSVVLDTCPKRLCTIYFQICGRSFSTAALPTQGVIQAYNKDILISIETCLNIKLYYILISSFQK